MFHTNVSFRSDSNSISIDDQYEMTGTRDINLGSSSHTTINKKHENDLSTEQKVPDIEIKGEDLYNDNNSYYSIKRLRERRRGERDEDSSLSRRVRRFYKDQDELIDSYERIQNQEGENNNGINSEEKQKRAKIQKMSNILTKISLGVNIFLFILKIVAAIMSKSLSVFSSVIDSAVDLATSVILFWTWRQIKKQDKYRYPQGRTRLEPIAIIILSVIMCAASIFVIYESINSILNDAKYFTEKNTTKTLSEIDMSTLPITVMVITMISKSILFFFCYQVKTPTMSALAADHRNDVASNLVALFCGLIGSFAYKNKINQKAIFIDAIGAILISFYIIFTWIQQARDQIKRLSGHAADPKFISYITWLTYNHSISIKKIDTVRAFYFGTSYLVEVDIVLPEDMILREVHDIGESLQKKIEDLPDVERAFVHIDYEYNHKPSHEHKIV